MPSAAPLDSAAGSLVDALAVPHEQVLGREAEQRARRPRAGGTGARRPARSPARKNGIVPSASATDEDAPLRPPERDLAPPADPQDRAELERRPRQLPRARRWCGTPSRCASGGAVAVVAVEQLDDARRLAELAHALLELRASRSGRRARRARRPRARATCVRIGSLLDPAEPRPTSSSTDAHAAPQLLEGRSKTSSGCAPSTSSRWSSRKAGTAFAPIEHGLTGRVDDAVAVAVARRARRRRRPPAARARAASVAEHVCVADVLRLAPVRVHQPVVHLRVPAEVAGELGQLQRAHRVRDDVGVRVVVEPARGEERTHRARSSRAVARDQLLRAAALPAGTRDGGRTGARSPGRRTGARSTRPSAGRAAERSDVVAPDLDGVLAHGTRLPRRRHGQPRRRGCPAALPRRQAGSGRDRSRGRRRSMP